MLQLFDTDVFTSYSLVEKCRAIWDHYLSRKRNDSFEPNWILRPYELAKLYAESEGKPDGFSDNDYFLLNETIKSHSQKNGNEVPVKTGFPNEGSRVMHDCWKAGSFTWIFMGRAEAKDAFLHKEFVILSRTLPDDLYKVIDKSIFAPQTLFAAYNLFDVSKNTGPAVCLDDLLNALP